MFLRKTKRNGRTYLSAVHGYKTKDGKSRAKTIKSFGYVDVLEKEFDDPIAHFTEVTKQMDLERKANESIEISFKANEMLDLNESSRKNFGYVVLSNLYHYLEIDYFINNRRRYEKFKFNANAIMKLLVYSRLLYPASKKNTVELKDRFFDKFDFKRKCQF